MSRPYPLHPEAFNFLNRFSSEDPNRIDMSSSIPISEPPEHITSSLKPSYKADQSRGGASRGKSSTLEQCRKYFLRKGINCNTENISLSNSGVLESILKTYSLLGITKESRQRVIVPTPTFGFYISQLAERGIEFDVLTTKKEDSFLPDPQELERLIDRTGASYLLLCYPNNPTGAVMSKEVAEQIAEIAKRKNIFIISDEVFMENRLGEEEHICIASLPDMLERTITLTSSAAKAMGFSAVKTSICLGPKNLMEGFAQLGRVPNEEDIIARISEDSEENRAYLDDNKQKYLTNIELVNRKITELNLKLSESFQEEKIFVKPFIERPEATNVYLLDFSGLRGLKNQKTGELMNTGLDVATWLLDEAHVGMVPGECFLFEPETMLVRMALGHKPEEIIKAFDNMTEATKTLQKMSPSTSPHPEDYDQALDEVKVASV